MSHRFVRCPHCKMPHDAAERVCPNTGLRLSTEHRAPTPARQPEPNRSLMSELPPPSRRPEPLAFDPQRDRVAERKPKDSSAEPSATMSPTRDLNHELLGQTVGGRYKIKGVLGEGGMGTVYDAEHLGLSRQVAIKVLSPSQAKKRVAVKRFQQEARAAGAIGHPNICEVYDLGLLDDGSPYLVMEKLVGQTLAERIAKEGGLPFEDVIECVSQVLSGLVAAHEKGIVHRDIKPENIFLARRVGCPPIIKLLDFGVSKMMAEFQTGDDALDLTRTGMVMGTPYYMSPEQARGERNLDGRVDVYACGVVMYEAIAGKRPFLAPNYNALLLAIINTTPRPLREVRPKTPPDLEAVINHAMARNRDDRIPTAKQFLRELTPAPTAEGSGARLPAPPTAEERKRAQVLGGARGRPEPSVRGVEGAARMDPSTRVEASTRGGRRGDAPQPSRSYHEPLDRPDGPSATLRSRMADSAQRIPVAPEHATRLDVRVKLIPSPFDSLGRAPEPGLPPLGAHDSDDSIDIPIHIMAEEEEDDDLPVDEDATEVFRPGKHPHPAAPRAQTAPASRRGGAPQKTAPITPVAPLVADASEDWDGETVVKRPDMLPPSRPPTALATPARPASRRRPFNPEETMKLDNGADLDRLIDGRSPPRRR